MYNPFLELQRVQREYRSFFDSVAHALLPINNLLKEIDGITEASLGCGPRSGLLRASAARMVSEWERALFSDPPFSELD
jgi:hypothetical protein